MRDLMPSVLILALACGGGGEAAPEPLALPAVGPPPDDDTPETLPASPPVTRLRPSFPLIVGDHWTWQVTRHVGAGLRVLFMPTEPATSDVISTWELTIDSAQPEGRFMATRTRTDTGALPQRTDLLLWLQDGDLWMIGPTGPQPALKLVVPPDAMATEKVPCIAAFLDNIPSFCSPAPGGPLDVPPGPVYGVVSSDPDNGRTLAQFLVGIGTAGVLIPGNKAVSEVLELRSWKTAHAAGTSPLVEKWRSKPISSALPALLKGPLAREDAAAIVALAPEAERMAVTRTTLAALPVPDRPALLRVALGGTPGDRLVHTARMADALGGVPTPGNLDAVVALLPEEDQAAGRAILGGGWPTLHAVLIADDADRTEALKASRSAVGPEESEAILARIDPTGPVLDVLLSRVPTRDRMGLVIHACAQQAFDEPRLALLDGRADLLAANAGDLDAVGRLLDGFSSDAAKHQALLRVIDVAAPGERSALLRLGVERLTFDDERLALLDARPEVTRTVNAADRDAILAAFVFDRDAALAKLKR